MTLTRLTVQFKGKDDADESKNERNGRKTNETRAGTNNNPPSCGVETAAPTRGG